MRHSSLFLALGLTGLLVVGCAEEGPPPPVPVTLENNGKKTMVFEVVAGTSSTDSAERVIKVTLEPGKKKAYSLPAGKYTLFPREYLFQGTFGLAFYPFTLKADKPMVVSLDTTNRPIFSGYALFNRLNAKETTAPSDAAAHGSAAAAKATPSP